ncbi:MAG: hypothetical protein ABFD79_13335 [Phycisphaerales bacterium]
MERKAQVRNKWSNAVLTALFVFILQETLFAGIAVSPITQQIEVKPGKKVNFTIYVANNQRNQKTIPMPARIDILDFKVSDRGVLYFGSEYKHSRSAADWITLDANQITLKPGESREIKGTVTAPSDADGDYWASAMVYIGKTKENTPGVQIQMRTATGLFIHVVRRPNSERGIITDVNITIPSFEAGPLKKDLSETDLYRINEKQSLKIEAKIKNEGLIAIPATGKAFIYNDKMKRIATIPLYASRNNVLPGDSRWFTGLMSQPLPAGDYKLRTFLTSEKTKRQITKDFDFSITEDLSNVWAKNLSTSNNITKLTLDPEEINLKLNPGRFTSANLQVTNQGFDTIAAKCRIEKSQQNWIELKKEDFTLAPNSSTSMPCTVKVPADAKAGVYSGTIVIEMEQSGLENGNKNNAIQYSVPVSITIDENAKMASKEE